MARDIIKDVLVGLAIGMGATWLALLAALIVVRPKGPLLAEALRILPDLLRLLPRLAADPQLSRGVRIRLSLLMMYLAFPIDLVPDFIPILGYADDVIIITAVVRGVVRRAGIGAVRRHWPGTDDGFQALCRLTGLPTDGPGQPPAHHEREARSPRPPEPPPGEANTDSLVVLCRG